MEFVNNGVPDCVQLTGGIVSLERETVATAITSRKFSIHSANRVHWLMNVSQIVDKKT